VRPVGRNLLEIGSDPSTDFPTQCESGSPVSMTGGVRTNSSCFASPRRWDQTGRGPLSRSVVSIPKISLVIFSG